MIHTNANIKLSKQEINLFRENMRKCVEKDYTPAELEIINKRRISIMETRTIIDKNNGGKNPILGY